MFIINILYFNNLYNLLIIRTIVSLKEMAFFETNSSVVLKFNESNYYLNYWQNYYNNNHRFGPFNELVFCRFDYCNCY